MSQTETILLILLGFSLASLVALFASRMLWSMAIRLGARRMQRQMPSSLVGLQTERDRLRAEFAMMQQRLGARLEEAELRLAEQMAEVSRHRNRMHHVETHEAGRDAALRDLTAQVRRLEAALAEAGARESALRRELAAREESLRKLRRKKGYEGHKQAQEKAPPAPAASEDAELRLRQRIGRLSSIARTMGEELATPPAAAMADKLADTERQMAELESELRKLDREWDAPAIAQPPAPDVPESNEMTGFDSRQDAASRQTAAS